MSSLPSEWKRSTLSDICTMRSGDGITSKDISDSYKYPCFGGNGFRGNAARFTHEGNYILVGRVGALCGNVLKVSGKFFASEHALVVTQKEEIDWQWLNYILDYLNLNQYAESSAQPVLTVSKLNKLPVVYPEDYNEQKKIAEILTSVDKVIELTEVEIEKLKNLKKGMMQDLLTKGIGHTKFKDSQIGKIPESWEENMIQNLSDDPKTTVKAGPFGSKIKKEFYVPKGYKVYGQEQVIKGDYKFGNYYINQELYDDLRSCSVKEGDLLMSLVGTVGKTLIIPSDAEEGVINPRLLRIRVNEEKCNIRFVDYYLQSSIVQQIVDRQSQGGTMDVLNATTLKKVFIGLPSIEEQQKIVEALKSVGMKIGTQEQKLVKNKNLRKGLMQDLLTGKVRVKV